MGRTFSTEEDRPWRPSAGGDQRVDCGAAGSEEIAAWWAKPFFSEANLTSSVGILSPGFASDPAAEIWLPLQADPNSTNLAYSFHGCGPPETWHYARKRRLE